MKAFKDRIRDLEEKGSEQVVYEWLEEIKKEEGAVPLIFERMSHRPDALISHLMYKSAVANTSALSPKTTELISIAVASVLRCRPCVDHHIKSAKLKGATKSEILEALLIAGMLAQSSVLADAYRALDADETECTDGSCSISLQK